MRRTFVGTHSKLVTGKDYKLDIARGNGCTAFIETEAGDVIIEYNSLSDVAKDWKILVEPKEENKKKKKKRRK